MCTQLPQQFGTFIGRTPHQYGRHRPCESALHGEHPQHEHVFDRSGSLRFLSFRHAFFFFFTTFSFKGVEAV
jgi:hypothetical protein